MRICTRDTGEQHNVVIRIDNISWLKEGDEGDKCRGRRN
jgi:hypothetical protein